MENQEKTLFTVKEIAAKLRKTPQAINKQIRTRKIPFEKFGRTIVIHKTDLHRFLE